MRRSETTVDSLVVVVDCLAFVAKARQWKEGWIHGRVTGRIKIYEYLNIYIYIQCYLLLLLLRRRRRRRRRKGARLKKKLKMDLDAWLEKVRQGEYLNEDELKQLCEYVKEILVEESCVQPVNSPVTVCGDIHGNFTTC